MLCGTPLARLSIRLSLIAGPSAAQKFLELLGRGSGRSERPSRLDCAANIGSTRKGASRWMRKHTSRTGRPRSPKRRKHNTKEVSILCRCELFRLQDNRDSPRHRSKSKGLRLLQPRQARKASSALPRCRPDPLEPFLAARTKRDTLQIKEKRLHVPLVDRLPDEPPPRLVTIVGPPGVGKTTLLWANPRSIRGSIGLADC